MAYNNSGLGWSEAQWEMVNNAVAEAFGKASVAGAFLPRYGPLPESAEYVRDERFTKTGAEVTVGDNTTLKLFNLTVKVEVSNEQAADDALSSALLAFRRAANTLAQVEDDIVFNGFDPDDATNKRREVQKTRAAFAQSLQGKPKTAAKINLEKAQRAARTALVVVSDHPDPSTGLANVDSNASPIPRPEPPAEESDVGGHVVAEVVAAIGRLEDDSHPGPFACVLGPSLFVEVHRPVKGSLVLPADRITPLLNGPLLRSGQMASDRGIVVSLAAGAIDIVVATPPKAQFLQRTANAKYLFRVYERFVLRIKDKKDKDDKDKEPPRPAVRAFEIGPAPAVLAVRVGGTGDAPAGVPPSAGSAAPPDAAPPSGVQIEYQIK